MKRERRRFFDKISAGPNEGCCVFEIFALVRYTGCRGNRCAFWKMQIGCAVTFERRFFCFDTRKSASYCAVEYEKRRFPEVVRPRSTPSIHMLPRTSYEPPVSVFDGVRNGRGVFLKCCAGVLLGSARV